MVFINKQLYNRYNKDQLKIKGNEIIEEEIIDEFGNKIIVRKKVLLSILL